MSAWTQVVYLYDGSFAGFLSCVFDSYVYKEAPAAFRNPEGEQTLLWPERAVETDEAHAKRVCRSLGEKLGAEGLQLVERGFLTCLPEKELHLWQLIRFGYETGRTAVKHLADSRVDMLRKAVQHLEGEAHLYKGFVRFSDQEGVLIAQIEPKNRVLPLMRPHFCNRFAGENFIIYDRTHKETLLHRPGQCVLLSMDALELEQPGQEELAYRRLWRRFYDAIAIEGRENPKCRMTHMPKRYWTMMTEFQTEEGALPPKAKNQPDEGVRPCRTGLAESCAPTGPSL